MCLRSYKHFNSKVQASLPENWSPSVRQEIPYCYGSSMVYFSFNERMSDHSALNQLNTSIPSHHIFSKSILVLPPKRYVPLKILNQNDEILISPM